MVKYVCHRVITSVTHLQTQGLDQSQNDIRDLQKIMP